MKLGKKAKKKTKEEVSLVVPEESSTPKTVQRRHTVCKITEETTDLLFDNGLNLIVEGVGEPLFEKEITELLPKADFWKKDSVFHVNPKHKDFVLNIALDYFSEILLFDAQGKMKTIRGNFP